MVITGNKAFGRFGLALASLGDLNDDGYEGKGESNFLQEGEVKL